MRLALSLLLLSGCAAMRVQLSRRDALASSCAALLATRQRQPVFAADAAVSVKRFSVEPKITTLMLTDDGSGGVKIGGLGNLGYSRFEDQLSTPKGSKAISVNTQFAYPSQFARLPPLQSITLVDGNSGLKVYVLEVKLPGTTLAETPKAWFGEAIFSPDGAIAKGGTSIDDYKVSSAKMIDAPEGAAGARKRLALKYTVITPANQRAVDRRAFADVYEFDGVAYILLASGTSSKWEGGEKERCEKIAESFVISI